MTARTRLAPASRQHVVLIPGFGGFDALGRVEYYSGITHLFQELEARHRPLPNPVVLHYFDNLPTAAVTTRAEKLRKYLARRMARGEILPNDKIILVGHSTGGLDIRRLVCDLHDRKNRKIHVDGASSVDASALRDCLNGIVFLSVPHAGTNIADWVYDHAALRKTVIAELRAAFAGSQVNLLDRFEAALAGHATCLTGADLFLALRDALTEANDRLCGHNPSCVADAQEAASVLQLYFRHMATNFWVINDLTAQAHDDNTSPAHFSDKQRREEFSLWDRHPIRTLSYATVGDAPFTSPPGDPRLRSSSWTRLPTLN